MQDQPTPPSSQSTGPGISGPIPVAHPQIIGGVPVSGGSMPASGGGGRKFMSLVLTVLLVTGLAAGGYWLWQNQSRTAKPPAPTPAPITTGDAEAAATDIESSLAEVDANLVGLDTSLADQQGELSER